MSKDKDLVAALPGSTRGDKNHVGVTNYVLMPTPSKAPGLNTQSARSNAVPAPHLLGTGSKIPESQQSRMCSQFVTPDPLKFAAKKQQQSRGGMAGPQSHYTPADGRQPSVPCSVYKTDYSSQIAKMQGEKATDGLPAKQAAIQKSNAEKQKKDLMGLKDRMLSTVCMDPNVRAGSSEVSQVVAVVTDINRKLGLPFYDMGSWRLPT